MLGFFHKGIPNKKGGKSYEFLSMGCLKNSWVKFNNKAGLYATPPTHKLKGLRKIVYLDLVLRICVLRSNPKMTLSDIFIKIRIRICSSSLVVTFYFLFFSGFKKSFFSSYWSGLYPVPLSGPTTKMKERFAASLNNVYYYRRNRIMAGVIVFDMLYIPPQPKKGIKCIPLKIMIMYATMRSAMAK